MHRHKIIRIENLPHHSDDHFNNPVERKISSMIRKIGGFTFIEVAISSAIAVLAFGAVMTAALRAQQISKFQSAYQTACSYGEQAVEYALYVPYADLSASAPTTSSPNWASNISGVSYFYTTATSTNLIATTKDGDPFTLTNITFLGTQTSLPLDDLGSYILQRWVIIQDRSTLEPSATNVNYKLITVSNTWVFLGRSQPPIVYRTIRDSP